MAHGYLRRVSDDHRSYAATWFKPRVEGWDRRASGMARRQKIDTFVLARWGEWSDDWEEFAMKVISHDLRERGGLSLRVR